MEHTNLTQIYEWDLSAYKRKFEGTTSLWKDTANGKQYLLHMVTFTEQSVVGINHDTNKKVQLPLKRFPDEGTMGVTPEYKHIKAAFYSSQLGPVFVDRRPNKESWKIGLHPSMFNIMLVSMVLKDALLVDIRKPLPVSTISLLESTGKGGALSDRLFVSILDDLFYREVCIGRVDFKNKRVDLEPNHAYLKQEVSDVFPNYVI